MKWKTTLPALALMMFASGCVSGGGGTDCAAFRPILMSDADIDAASDALARAILAHNETGARACGWG